MPSGMLCSVTAETNSVVRFQSEGTPSGSSASAWRCGRNVSSAMRKATPRRKPPAAGSQPGTPSPSACSIAGLSSDHTLAATITPAAKPRKMWCMSLRSERKKNTTAEPAVVMSQVKPQPSAAHASACGMLSIIWGPLSLSGYFFLVWLSTTQTVPIFCLRFFRQLLPDYTDTPKKSTQTTNGARRRIGDAPA